MSSGGLQYIRAACLLESEIMKFVTNFTLTKGYTSWRIVYAL